MGAQPEAVAKLLPLTPVVNSESIPKVAESAFPRSLWGFRTLRGPFGAPSGFSLYSVCSTSIIAIIRLAFRHIFGARQASRVARWPTVCVVLAALL